jgi:hypothetical protein
LVERWRPRRRSRRARGGPGASTPRLSRTRLILSRGPVAARSAAGPASSRPPSRRAPPS